MDNNNLGLYIHVPFCKAKCYYCDFNSFPGRDEIIPGYFDALLSEIKLYSERLKGYTFKTVFIGGGTPSLVEPRQMYNLLNTCSRYLNMDKDMEISIESNPGTLSFEKLFAYKTMGINRLSIGLQAWQNRLLNKLGRIHSQEEFVENFKIARKVGFKNINVDLIFGVPTQTLRDWKETLENVMGLEPTHLSCYSLKIEEETEYGKWADSGELIALEDELDREMYLGTIEMLYEKGYKQYEISNFSKVGFECRHNLIYWKAQEYIGLGAGAHSYFVKERYNNLYDIEAYISSINSSNLPVENKQFIDTSEEISEFMILGLRLIEGISLSEFKVKFNKDLKDIYGKEIEKLIRKGLLELVEDNIRLTALGLDLANDVFVEFI